MTRASLVSRAPNMEGDCPLLVVWLRKQQIGSQVPSSIQTMRDNLQRTVSRSLHNILLMLILLGFARLDVERDEA